MKEKSFNNIEFYAYFVNKLKNKFFALSISKKLKYRWLQYTCNHVLYILFLANIQYYDRKSEIAIS